MVKKHMMFPLPISSSHLYFWDDTFFLAIKKFFSNWLILSHILKDELGFYLVFLWVLQIAWDPLYLAKNMEYNRYNGWHWFGLVFEAAFHHVAHVDPVLVRVLLLQASSAGTKEVLHQASHDWHLHATNMVSTWCRLESCSLSDICGFPTFLLQVYLFFLPRFY